MVVRGRGGATTPSPGYAIKRPMGVEVSRHQDSSLSSSRQTYVTTKTGPIRQRRGFCNAKSLFYVLLVIPSTILFLLSFQFIHVHHEFIHNNNDSSSGNLSIPPKQQSSRKMNYRHRRHSYYEQRKDQLVTLLRRMEPKSQPRRLPYEFSNSRPAVSAGGVEQHNICLCTHLTTNKLDRFLVLVQKWNGPVSVSIYITTENQLEELFMFYDEHNSKKVFNSIDVHVLLEKLPSIEDKDYMYYGYPHNTLRNMAVEFALNVTEYILSLDVDFMTQQNASEALTKMIDANPRMIRDLQQNNVVMVLPAFEQTIGADTVNMSSEHNIKLNDANTLSHQLPQTKPDLMNQISQKKIEIAHQSFPPCQRATNYPKWFKDDEDGKRSDYYYIDYELKFEPYTIVYRNISSSSSPPSSNLLLPKYYESFRGWGYDKSSFYMELYFSGYKFAVLKDWFVIHMYHKSTKPIVDDPTFQGIDTPGNQQEQIIQTMIQDRYKKFRHYLQAKFAWDDKTYQMIFQESPKSFVGYNKLKNNNQIDAKEKSMDKNIPILVGWKEYNGVYFGS